MYLNNTGDCWVPLSFQAQDLFRIPLSEVTNVIMERFVPRNRAFDSGFFLADQLLSDEFLEILNDSGLGKILGYKEEDGSITGVCLAFLTRAGVNGVLHSDVHPDIDGDLEYIHSSFHINLSGTGSISWFNATDSYVETDVEEVKYLRYNTFNEKIDTNTYNGVSLYRVDVPHRGENLAGWKPRLTLTFRFDKNPTFEECVEAFKDYVVPRPK